MRGAGAGRGVRGEREMKRGKGEGIGEIAGL